MNAILTRVGLSSSATNVVFTPPKSSLRAGVPGKDDSYVQRADYQRGDRPTQFSTGGHSPARDIITAMSSHSIESTARYLGVEVDDALEIAEKIDV